MGSLRDTQPLRPSPTILVIDDSRVACQLACALLEPFGYRVVTQLGPLGTAPVIERERPDLILVDVTMPGMGGDQVVAYLRRHGSRDVPILLYSERAPEELRALCEQCGAVGFVYKANAREELVREVQRWAPSQLPTP